MQEEQRLVWALKNIWLELSQVQESLRRRKVGVQAVHIEDELQVVQGKGQVTHVLFSMYSLT